MVFRFSLIFLKTYYTVQGPTNQKEGFLNCILSSFSVICDMDYIVLYGY